MRKHFLIEDEDPIKVTLATYVANHFSGDALWCFLIAPPSSLKTEIISSLSGLDDIYPLSDLTEKTLLSGFEGGKPSLIKRLDKKILVMKDFTTVLSMRRERRAEILAQLREIYDGAIKKVYGTGAVVDWNGKLGFIAGVTPEIDRHYAVFQSLGERFLQIRLAPVDPMIMAKKAINRTGQEQHFRKEVRETVKSACIVYSDRAETGNVPLIDEQMENRLAALATICVKGRSHVARNRWSKEIEYLPEPEAPARFAKQLAMLAQGLAVLRLAPNVEQCDYEIVYRVALDCLPVIKAKALKALFQELSVHNNDLSRNLRLSNSTIKRTMEDMETLGLVNKKGDSYSLSPETSVYAETIKNPQCTH